MGKFAVSAGHDLTANAAGEVLRAGGTAVDAAISAALMACIAEPVLAGPLAGGFLMVAPKGGAAHCLDAFVQTPRHKRSLSETDHQEALVDFGETTQIFHCGAGTIATPGLIPGLFEAHLRYGRIPMPELAQAAISAAREGVVTTAFQSEVLGYVSPIFDISQPSRDIYKPDGRFLLEGDILKNPQMADVLEVMAVEGARFVQEGEIASALLSLDGSHLQLDDLKSYRPIWRKPLKVSRKNIELDLNPSPSLGGVQIALALLALPENADDAMLSRCLFEVASIRKSRDLDHHPAEGEAIMLNPDLVQNLRKILNEHMAATRGTTHISVIDGDGNGAALTLSNGEGCGLIVPGTGIMANNMLGEDDLVPDGPNSWAEDTRLASMMCPMALRDGDGLTMLGSGGSNRIRSALARVVTGIVDRGESLEQAILAPRQHLEPDTDQVLDFEDLGSEERREALLREFPNANAWPRKSMFFGGVHGVRYDGKSGFDAAGDPRRSGATLTK